jgi:tetratricopeptide (TPR) repeat protein
MQHFELHVETDPEQGIVRLRLLDQHAKHLASSQVKLADHSGALWQGLFDTRTYVDRYTGSLRQDANAQPKTPNEILADLGLDLGQKVLGKDIMAALAGSHHRTLLLQLPDTAKDDPLAAAFARVPWEIARATPQDKPLFERNVVVRAVIPGTQPVAGEDGEADPLRVLLVFAEAPGSRPLAMRLEREQLLALFFDDILPRRRVEVDVLCHGVTRARLEELITSHGGYGLIHWSGHGHHNCLELVGPDGKPELLTGQDLVQLISNAGGFVPQLVFLSACLSGTFVELRNWQDFHAAMTGARPGRRQVEEREVRELVKNQSGYTGTALELLRAGVPQVVAMRYEVGDDYACELARHFYRHLLADDARHPAEKALSLARGELARAAAEPARGFDPVDHATPVLFGEAQEAFAVMSRKSAQLLRRRPQPQPLLPGGARELDASPLFVGRSAELTRLAGQWLPRDQAGVALVQGLAGLGKTALAAEAIHLWHTRFDHVFAFQAKPLPLGLEEFFRQLDLKLQTHSETYREACQASAGAFLHLPTDGPLKGAARYEQMRANLIEALRNENILLVLDNFETNLETVADAHGYACKDPEWDKLLAALIEHLPQTGSRLLITSRHRLKALHRSGGRQSAAGIGGTLPSAATAPGTLWLPLGPLPLGEAALYIRSHDGLRDLYYSGDTGQQLVHRLLQFSRGHPLILDRLAALARDPKGLAEALDALEAKGGWQNLPDLFAKGESEEAKKRERDYLEDVAIGAVDLLLQRAHPDARRLLWIITLANEPVPTFLAKRMWLEHGADVAKEMGTAPASGAVSGARAAGSRNKDRREGAPTGTRGACAPQSIAVEPLLDQLQNAGLLTTDEDKPAHSFHELVRERGAHWMAEHPEERAGRTEVQVWRAYAERYEAIFDQLRTSGQPGAMERAAEVGRRALSYFVRARAFDRLGEFANNMLTSTSDPAVLRGAIEELGAVVDQAPPGPERWRLRGSLADALDEAGRSDEALSFHAQAAAEAEAGKNWADLAVICQSCANALVTTGDLPKAKATYLRSAEAGRKAGHPRCNAVASELSALRVDVMQGHGKQVWPEIEQRLNEVRAWWRRHRKGQSVPEAPDSVLLGRSLVSSLNIAVQAALALERWETCLELLRELEQTERNLGQSELELTRTRFNQHTPLLGLGQLGEAQRLLESCLAVYRAEEYLNGQQRVLSALARVWKERGDLAKAVSLERQALAICNRLPDPAERAISHNNLANYLRETGSLDACSQHRLAAILYFVLAGYGQHIKTVLRALANDRQAAAQGGQHYELPRLGALLALPEFAALAQFLTRTQVDIAQLQSRLDALEAQVHEQPEAEAQAPQMPPELQAIFARLAEAAAAKQALDPLLTEVRAKLLELQPGTEADADALIAHLCAQLTHQPRRSA